MGERMGPRSGSPWRCHYCRARLAPKDRTRDHVIPRSRGGLTIPDNLVWACKRCNEAKGDRLPTHDCKVCRKAARVHLAALGLFAEPERSRLMAKVAGLYPGVLSRVA